MMNLKEIKTMLDNAGYCTSLEVMMDIYDLLNYNDEGIASMVLSGPTGCGKTKLMSILMDRFCGVMYSCTIATTEKHLVAEPDLHHVILKDPTKVVRKKVLAEGIERGNNGCDLCVICIDEFDKAPPSADYFMYEFLQSGRLSGTILGDLQVINTKKVVVIFGKNDYRELSEPLLRRGAYIELPYPKIEYVRKDILSKLNDIDNDMLDFMLNLYGLQLKNPKEFTKIATMQEMRIAMKQDVNRKLQLIGVNPNLLFQQRIRNIIYSMAKTKTDRENLIKLTKTLTFGGGRIVFDNDEQQSVNINFIELEKLKGEVEHILKNLQMKFLTLDNSNKTSEDDLQKLQVLVNLLNNRVIRLESSKKVNHDETVFKSLEAKIKNVEREVDDFVKLFNSGS